jgi:hypothetical protein
VAGLSASAAVDRLCAVGLHVGGAVKAVSGPAVRSHRRAGLTVVRIWVVGTDPPAGASVAVGSPVTIRFGAPANVAVALPTGC